MNALRQKSQKYTSSTYMWTFLGLNILTLIFSLNGLIRYYDFVESDDDIYNGECNLKPDKSGSIVDGLWYIFKSRDNFGSPWIEWFRASLILMGITHLFNLFFVLVIRSKPDFNISTKMSLFTNGLMLPVVVMFYVYTFSMTYQREREVVVGEEVGEEVVVVEEVVEGYAYLDDTKICIPKIFNRQKNMLLVVLIVWFVLIIGSFVSTFNVVRPMQVSTLAERLI